MTNFAEQLLPQVHAQRVALRDGATAVSFHALARQRARAAARLSAVGVHRGDRVGMQLPNTVEFVALYAAILSAGAVAVPMNPLLKRGEIFHQLHDSGAVIMVGWQGADEQARLATADAGAQYLAVGDGEFSAVEPSDERSVPTPRRCEDPAVLIYTSGTTGVPKGAVLTHGNLLSANETLQELICPSVESVTVGALPLFHIFGLTYLNLALTTGSSMSLLKRFEARDVLELITRDRATIMPGVPTMYAAMLHQPERSRFDMTSLRIVISGGAAMPAETLRVFESEFGATVLEGWGLTESTGLGAFNRPDRLRKTGSIGLPSTPAELRVVDPEDRTLDAEEVGEILLRAPFLMPGYWNNPSATADTIRNGWLYTGDLGYRDSDGYFYVIDRKKELIIRGGYNVYPREVEEVLYAHPAVREAAVIGRPDEQLGEEIVAVVALELDRAVAGADLRDFVRERIAAYKYPREIYFVDELPKNATGKISKRLIVLADQAAARAC